MLVGNPCTAQPWLHWLGVSFKDETEAFWEEAGVEETEESMELVWCQALGDEKGLFDTPFPSLCFPF